MNATIFYCICLIIGNLMGGATGKIVTTHFSHDFHNSICQIDYNIDNKSLEIAVSLFIDDTETAILQELGDTIRFEVGKQNEMADPALSYYLNKHLHFQINQQPVTWQWVGKEVTHDQIWCYVEIKNVRRLKKLWVKNSIFTELFDDQTNWVHLQVKGKKRSIMLQTGQIEGVLAY